MIPKRSQLSAQFGEIHNGIWIDQATHLKKIMLPAFLLNRWCYAGKAVRSMLINKVMEKPLYNSWSRINERNLAEHIHSYDGCFVIRPSRSDQRPSVHSWALAIDVNASSNRLGTRGDMNYELVKCFTDSGFVWGGEWKKPDPMHFQYVMED